MLSAKCRPFCLSFNRWLKILAHKQVKVHKPWFVFFLCLDFVSLLFPRWRHQMETFSALLALCGGIHRSSVDFPHKGQWRVALMFSLICAWINGWVNIREAGDLRRHRSHYDVTVMHLIYMVVIVIGFRVWDDGRRPGGHRRNERCFQLGWSFPCQVSCLWCSVRQSFCPHNWWFNSLLPWEILTRFKNANLNLDLLIGVYSDLFMIMPSDECHRILLMISPHWVRQWLGAVRQQAITWSNVDLWLHKDKMSHRVAWL